MSRWAKRSFMAMTSSELINKYVATLRELHYGLPVNVVWERRGTAQWSNIFSVIQPTIHYY